MNLGVARCCFRHGCLSDPRALAGLNLYGKARGGSKLAMLKDLEVTLEAAFVFGDKTAELIEDAEVCFTSAFGPVLRSASRTQQTPFFLFSAE